MNPVNPEEDFTDKWENEPRYYQAFKAFCEHLYNQWQELTKENGIISEARIFKNLFGDDLYIKAQASQSDVIEKARYSNQLGISKKTETISSLIAPVITPIKPNTFFGTDEN